MMTSPKIATYLILFLPCIIFGQTNNCAIKIFVQKKQTKEPVIDSLLITVSNKVTTKYKAFPNDDGETYIKFLEPGKYDVSVSVKGFVTHEVKNLIVGEARTAYTYFRLTTIEEAKTKNRRRKKN